MNSKENLLSLRKDIDHVDKELVLLFGKRLRLSEQIAQVKADGNMAITDLHREQQVIDAALAASDESDRASVISFMQTLIALSKMRQEGK